MGDHVAEQELTSRYDVLGELRLDGLTALVTGGSRGLGHAMALALASAGATVAITGRDESTLEQAAEEIRARTAGSVLHYTVDLLDPDQRNRFVRQIQDDTGRIDVLVNNAGIGLRCPALQMDESDWAKVIELDLSVPFYMARAFAPGMLERRFGRIINVSSALGLIAFPGRAAYCSAKGGLIMLTKALALEWAESGVTVNALCPGPFETENNKVIQQDPVAYRYYLSLIPVRRWAKPTEIGPLAVYLASRASSFVTGAVYVIDGGWTAQ